MNDDEIPGFLAVLREEHRQGEPIVRNQLTTPGLERSGMITESLQGYHEIYGLAAYIIDHDTSQFRREYRTAAMLHLSVQRRYMAGEPIDSSFMSMNESHPTWNALAAGEFFVAAELAQRTGGRDEIEKTNDVPFFRALGYCLKGTILDDRALIDGWFSLGDQQAERKRFRNFRSLLYGLKAISLRDQGAVNQAVKGIVESYQRECRPSSDYFESPIHKLLCLHGVGFVNLARWKGLDVAGLPPLIPEDLLVSVSQ